MSKKTNASQRTLMGCGGLIVLAYISIHLAAQSASKRWDNQLATLIATDDSISAFGDDSHAVPIYPAEVLSIGETGTLFEMEITLENAGLIKPAEINSGKWAYWFVEVTGKSISNEIQYGINPGVEAQVQYQHHGYSTWGLDEYDQTVCEYENQAEGLDPLETFRCRFVYMIPADDRDIYWVYPRTGLGKNGEYEERAVVFQIR